MHGVGSGQRESELGGSVLKPEVFPPGCGAGWGEFPRKGQASGSGMNIHLAFCKGQKCQSWNFHFFLINCPGPEGQSTLVAIFEVK